MLSEVNFEKRFAELPEYKPLNDSEDSRQRETSSKGRPPGCSGLSSSPASKTWKASNDSLDALAEVAAGVSSNQEGPASNGLKRNMDHKRNLVQQFLQERGLFPSEKDTNDFLQMHDDVFPNKSSLQLKIREVRQKCMQR